MLPFFYDQKNKKRKDNFVQEYAYIEEYIPWEQPTQEVEKKKTEERGIVVIDM